jgi:glucose/mannose-6-phosphate isomerase
MKLDTPTIEQLDSSHQLADILAMPEHLGDALWRVESAGMEPWESPGGLVVAGMGGSAIGGLLARAALGDHASRPILAARDYALPPWATGDATVLCASYSGNTEETLAAYDAAGVLGARRVAVTTGGRLAELARADGVPVIPLPGGFQPRAAVAYMMVSALEVAFLCGAAPRVAAEIDVAAAHLGSLVERWGPGAPEDSLAKSLARVLHATVPVIIGAGLTGPVAYRWKTQLNENAKLPAFAHELPEADHNEICGWAGAEGIGTFSAVFLSDCDTHPRTKARIELTEELVAPYADTTHVVSTLGETTVERVMSLVLLGDLVSLYAAVQRGVDPGPVEVLVRLKDALASRET